MLREVRTVLLTLFAGGNISEESESDPVLLLLESGRDIVEKRDELGGRHARFILLGARA